MMSEVPVRLTLDTNLLQELWKKRSKREVVERILALPDVDLAVTATIHEDVPRSPLADRLRDLPTLGISQTPRLARFGTWVLGVDMLGSQDFVDFEAQVQANWAPGNRRLPDQRDLDHLHAHLAQGRDVFLTWDRAILALAPELTLRLGITVKSPEDYLDRADR